MSYIANFENIIMIKKILKNVQMDYRCYQYQGMLIKMDHISSYHIDYQISKTCHHKSSGDIYFIYYFHHPCILLHQLKHWGK